MAYKSNKTSSSTAAQNMKYEVADEMGVTLGADSTAYDNGRVGGEITRKLVSEGMKKVDVNSMKEETANELGVSLGAQATARSNGSVGGSMTKKLVQKGKEQSNNN